MVRAKSEANQELGNRRRVHTPMRRRSIRSYNPDGSMQGLAAANANSAGAPAPEGRGQRNVDDCAGASPINHQAAQTVTGIAPFGPHLGETHSIFLAA
jgi:hypothetical protein